MSALAACARAVAAVLWMSSMRRVAGADFGVIDLSGSIPTLSCGGFHNCILNQSGHAVCWGKNDRGQTNVPPTAGKLKWLSAGSDRTCGLTLNGTAVCWGNTLFPIGFDSFRSTGKASQLITTAGWTTCSIEPSPDSVGACWGWGDARVGVDGFKQGRIPKDQHGEPRKFSYVSASQFHTCGLDLSGDAVCWGRNDFYQASIPQTVMVGNQRRELPRKWLTLTTGKFHTCGIQLDGKPICWGDNKLGQANFPEDGINKPYDLGEVIGISAGNLHTCVVTTGHQLKCWGWNGFGQCNAPIGDIFVLVSSGAYHSCAIDFSGAVHCWGMSSMNQAGVPELARIATVNLSTAITGSVSQEHSHYQAAPPVPTRDPFWFA